jgi:S1-C subfamily serine protease
LLKAAAALVVAVAVLAGVGLGHAVWPTQSASSPTNTPNTIPSGGSGSPSTEFPPSGSGNSGSGSGNSSTGVGAPSDTTSIASKVDPALVDINTNLSYQNAQAAGTGMVISSNGVILTNNHVIEGATSISVTDVGNGKTYTGTVVGYDRTADVAVVKLANASGLKTVSISTATAAVGQAVVGVGNAGGTGGTPSAAGGSITAVNQSITASDQGGGNAENLTGLIEVNAGIQPGDSGGALVDTSGQVIGMDTAASTGSGYQVSGTQAYAIPIANALTIAKQIEAGKASSTVHIGATGFLGVSVSASGGGNAGNFGGGSATTPGAAVASVLPNSPASQAGLAQGDVITAVNGASVGSATDLSNLLQNYHPGDSVQLGWTDASGQGHTTSVTLTTGPPA